MGQSRSMERLARPVPPPSDEALVAWLRSFASGHPRLGYKRAHSEANKQKWSKDIKRICRLWRNRGLKVPYRKRKKPTHGKGIAMGGDGKGVYPSHSRQSGCESLDSSGFGLTS